MQTNPAVEQNKNIKWSESPWNQSGRKGRFRVTDRQTDRSRAITVSLNTAGAQRRAGKVRVELTLSTMLMTTAISSSAMQSYRTVYSRPLH